MGVENPERPPAWARTDFKRLKEAQEKRRKRATIDELDRDLQDLLSFYRDVLVVQVDGEVPLVNAEQLANLEKVARRGSPESTMQAMEAILPTESGRLLTESLATTGMISAMYSEASGWPALRLGLAQALDGDGTVLLALADQYAERNPDGTYASNVNSAFPAISCTDRPESATLKKVQLLEQQYEGIPPIFGRGFAWSAMGCRDWPAPGGEFPTRVVAKGADPIVVIGTTRDPATPYSWSLTLAKSLESAVLVSRDGDEHTGYNAGNACVDDAVDRYLVSGEVPRDPTMC